MRIQLNRIMMQVVLVLSISSTCYGQDFTAVERVELDKYLGIWYEIARKPVMWKNKCTHDVTVIYTLNENGHLNIESRCYGKNGRLYKTEGEAFIQNEPYNSKLKLSFLPEAVRWLPVGRGDYWILKVDPKYGVVLIGEPKRKFLWILARDPHLKSPHIQQYLHYAKSLGYDLSDIIFNEHKAK